MKTRSTSCSELRGACLGALSLLLISSGCAHRTHEQRARALLITGAVATIAGAVTTSGCADAVEGEGCGGGPDAVDVGLGVPLLLGAVALIAGGIVAQRRSRGGAPRVLQPAPPPPLRPDPFDEPRSLDEPVAR